MGAFGQISDLIGLRGDLTQTLMVGVLILQIPVGMINAFMNDSRGVGESVEAYLVGPDMLTRSSSRFEGGHQTLDPVPAHDFITAALNGVSAFYPSVEGHDGQDVAAFSEPFHMMGADMAIVIEQDRAELMAPVNRSMTFLLLVSVACNRNNSNNGKTDSLKMVEV